MLEHLPICRGKAVVSLVNDDERRFPWHGAQPSDERLNGSDLHSLVTALVAVGDEAVRNVEGGELARRLIDQLAAMHKDQRAESAITTGRSDLRKNDGLSGASGELQEDGLRTIGECLPNVVDRLLLIWTQLHVVALCGLTIYLASSAGKVWKTRRITSTRRFPRAISI